MKNNHQPMPDASPDAGEKRYSEIATQHRKGAYRAKVDMEMRRIESLAQGDPRLEECQRSLAVAESWKTLGETTARLVFDRYAWMAASFAIGIPVALFASAIYDPAVVGAVFALWALAARAVRIPFAGLMAGLAALAAVFGAQRSWIAPIAAFACVAVAALAVKAVLGMRGMDVASAPGGATGPMKVRVGLEHRRRWNYATLALVALAAATPAFFAFGLPWNAIASSLGVPRAADLNVQTARRSAIVDLRMRHYGPGSDFARQAADYPGTIVFSILDGAWVGDRSGWAVFYPKALVDAQDREPSKGFASEPLWVTGQAQSMPGQAVYSATNRARHR